MLTPPMLASRVSVARTFLQARAVRPCTSRALSVSAMAAAYPKLKLVYFNIKARAEPTRLALHIAGIPFEDKRIAHEEWPALKATMPLGQIPVSSAQPSAASAAASVFAAARSASRLHGLRDVTNPGLVARHLPGSRGRWRPAGRELRHPYVRGSSRKACAGGCVQGCAGVITTDQLRLATKVSRLRDPLSDARNGRLRRCCST